MDAQFFLVRLRWGSAGKPMLRPLKESIIKSAPFTASGWRNGADCYLFISRSEAEAFKRDVHENYHPQKIEVLEQTAEDAARMDLELNQYHKAPVRI
jgi:hypothetical protein